MSELHEKHPPGRGVGLYLTGVALLVAVAIGASIVARSHRSAAQSDRESRENDARRGPRVRVTQVTESTAERTVDLLGEARPFYATTLYAKISGYLRTIRVDRGDRVRHGQVLAILDTPELEHQVQAAHADAANRREVAVRDRALARPGIVSQQEADTAEYNARAAEANVGALASQREYRIIRAPYDGIVTARYADPGALLQAAVGAQTSALPVVRIADVSRLRVFVYPEQHDASFIRVGEPAEISLIERPDQPLHATVSRVSGELDARSRTLLAEIDVDNHEGRITAGSFVHVMLRIHAQSYPQIPAEALVMRGTQPWVAVVDGQNRIAYRRVQLVDDDGVRVRVFSGLQPGEHVALSLGDSVDDGTRVRPVMAASPAAGPSGAPGAGARGGGAPDAPAIRR